MTADDPEATPPSGRTAGRRQPSGRLRRLVLLGLLAVLSVPLVTAPDRIAIAVDGEVVRLRSYADTVDDALAAAGVEVGPDDAVAPARDEPVADGLDIEVVRAVPVTLVVDGRTAVLPVAGETVGDVLVAAGIGDVRGLSVTPDPSTPLSRTRRVEVVDPVTVRIRVGDRRHVVRMREGTVADALALARVNVRERDRVSMPLDAELTDDRTTVTVTRRDVDRAVEKVSLPFDERVVETDELFEDERRVAQEGAEGLRRDVYRVLLVNGEERSRERIRRRVVRKPVDRVIHVGTRPRPAPEPEPEPEPEPAPEPPPPAPSQDDGVWYRLAECESGGNWATQGTYHGGLQFHPDTWNAWKPSGYPAYAYQASAAQQITVGKRLQAAQGWSPWPHCSQKLGLR